MLKTIETSSVTSYTVGSAIEISGVGLHTGTLTRLKILPSAGEGRYFVRTDLPGKPSIPALVEFVRSSTLSVELAKGDASVRTVEHLLAACVALGVESVRIEVDGPELPLLDGSAQPWVMAIASAGVVPVSGSGAEQSSILALGEMGLGKGDSVRRPLSPLFVQEGDAFVTALPAQVTRFTYGIEFESAAIGKQWHSWTPAIESFSDEIAPARTFTLARYVEQMRQAGLIKGGNLESALVCDETDWLNPPLRFANEPVRHKILDLVGDLSLLGKIPCAHYVAYKASHKLHVQLARLLAANDAGY
ncbi:UDP-3-O-acyl-N-acetylglucosamine deacetylase [Ancylothrix sp. C2]|uniref:UDP-3-O-acyl-N-acetylglucosamine deacetylase n=1 Tax=Ancylothrix sp. D3o TaxID=2953691 RepID=UPI0021BAF7BB|nr:UDP-3-O-acyl-N-acetylglucosamine deacetylase [Ancylothrix sp. D3o]MCT7948448.1 UDP-3-O-acyl-N-acetylglucosamine deacetylase [Ancylothrix sp. D3o]